MAENSEKFFANLSGHELVAKWRTGSHEAAAVLMDRYRLHLSRVVHGDLTPNNILIATDGREIVTDFGLSTCLQPIAQSQSADSAVRSVGGTLGYAAPEQVSPAFGSIGAWTDINAIGALAYFCLTGRSPHAKSDVAESLTSTISEEDEKLPSNLPITSASKMLCKLVKLALRKTVTDRPNDIPTMMAALHDRF